ncbi:MAG: response regulator [Acidobacteria bacterium]|nr:response regulator [Acidobacteriota bacterium]
MIDSPTKRATLTALLVDDEELARSELTFLLADHPDIEILAHAANGLEAVELISDLEPDVVFLDVQMPGLDGLGVARKLVERGGPLPYFIFATAYDQYAVEAFAVEASDYLLKPIEKKRLAQALDRARRRVLAPVEDGDRMAELLAQLQPASRGPSKLLVKHGSRMVLVDASDLIYATIEEGEISVVATSVEGLSNYRTIEELQSHLDPHTFWRAHRSYLVNINRIKEVAPWFKSSYRLLMADRRQTEIPVSRAQTKRLRELFKL